MDNLTPEEVGILLGLAKAKASTFDKNTKAGQESLVPYIPLIAKLEEESATRQVYRIAKEHDDMFG